MISPFSFRGELDRRTYVLAAGAAFFAQHLFVVAVYALSRAPFTPEWWFWFNPFRALVMSHNLAEWTLLLACGLALLVAWMLAALSFRRAKQADLPAGFATLAIVPLMQIAAVSALSLAPPRAPEPPNDALDPSFINESPKAHAVALGLLVGVALCVGAVALTALVLRSYGYGLFLGTPFVVGLSTALIANRNGDIGFGATQSVVFAALGLGALALLVLAFEGAICLVLSAPISAGMAFFGGVFGRAASSLNRRNISSCLASIAALPLLMTGEALVPPRVAFESVESIEIDAPPDAVWDAITNMGPIPDAPPAPFSWGLAYPISGELLGEGVGAVRRGDFSTGVAYERVTIWAPGERLAFAVLTNPPMMRELTPYERINAPHIDGYFRSTHVDFTITPLANGRSRLLFVTRHELDIEPAIYWTPFARAFIHANKQRVMNHFKQQAEAAL